jgi:putative SOS response-associated peptidase YedK
MLTPEQEDTWLDSEIVHPNELMPVLAPLDARRMELFPVSRLVNSVANEGPSLRQRAEEAQQAALL